MQPLTVFLAMSGALAHPSKRVHAWNPLLSIDVRPTPANASSPGNVCLSKQTLFRSTLNPNHFSCLTIVVFVPRIAVLDTAAKAKAYLVGIVQPRARQAGKPLRTRAARRAKFSDDWHYPHGWFSDWPPRSWLRHGFGKYCDVTDQVKSLAFVLAVSSCCCV